MIKTPPAAGKTPKKDFYVFFSFQNFNLVLFPVYCCVSISHAPVIPPRSVLSHFWEYSNRVKYFEKLSTAYVDYGG